jgi:hypothetical protein
MSADPIEACNVGRRELAVRLRLCVSCPFPNWVRDFMADVLLLPVAHPAASPAATAAALLACARIGTLAPEQYADSSKSSIAARAGADVGDMKGVAAREHDVATRVIPIPATPTCFEGPYAFRTADELRHALLPGAHLRLQLSALESNARPHCMGYTLMTYMIGTSSSPWSHMAPWLVALAQSCGGLEPSLESHPSGYAPTPFCHLYYAARSCVDIANALLDVPTTDKFAVDVDNRRAEPTLEWKPDSPGGSILHMMLRLLRPDMPLWRRLLLRCSDATLNDMQDSRQTPLHSAVQFCYELPASSRHFDDAKQMLLMLLDRANPDGTGVDLYLRAPCTWLPSRWHRTGASSCVRVSADSHLTAYEALVRVQPAQYSPRDCTRLESIVEAFASAFGRQQLYRDRLAAALSAALLDPKTCSDAPLLPVRELIVIVNVYLLPATILPNHAKPVALSSPVVV